MSDVEQIVRLAAKGDGVSSSGRHVAGAVPGDLVQGNGNVSWGPHHINPPCRHFARCGGCQMQHADDEVLAGFVTDRVLTAARKQDLEPLFVAPTHLSPPFTRRRAVLHAVNHGGRPLVGYREGGTHRIVDFKECLVLAPELFALVEPIRALLARRSGRYAVDIALTSVDQGVDCAFSNLPVEGLAEIEALLAFARHNRLARLSHDQGYGSETIWEPEPATVTLSGVSVGFPVGAFLQATRDGEAALIQAARDWLGDGEIVADLFAGIGTFAFALAGTGKALAVEAARDAHLTSTMAARKSDKALHTLHRDLFRNPLRAEELDRFGAVLLDPPRAGAREQIAQIAESSLKRVVYISCNPSSWARDTKVLVNNGFRLQEVRPVGQFRWSTHVELASYLTR